MRQSRTWSTRVLLLASLALFVGAGCGGGSGGDDDEEPGDLPPSVVILEPADQAEFAQGEQITFRGRGTDPEDGDLPETVLNWSSSIDGPFGLGLLVRRSDLSYGVHEITLRGIDSEGQFATDTIEITVLAPLRGVTTAGDLVISEAQVNPGPVTGVDGEWFEIYNPTDNRLDISGLTIRDDGTDFHTLVGSIILDPKAYFVLGRTRDVGLNGGAPVDYAYGTSFTLDDVTDEIVLQAGPTTIDRVAYDALTWPIEEGIAMSLSDNMMADDLNDIPENWCQPSTPYGTLGLRGTPQEQNPTCVP